MKRLLLFALISGLIACNENTQTKLIGSFVCTRDGVTSDLGFKIVKLVEIAPVTVTDSMLYFIVNTLPEDYKWIGDSLSFSYLNENGVTKNETIAKTQIDSEMVFWVTQRAEADSSLTEAKANLESIQKSSDKHSFDYKSFMTNLFQSTIESSEKIVEVSDLKIHALTSAKRYSRMRSDDRLLRAFECTYSILNPNLKVRQTQTQTFYFDNALLKIVSSSGIKK
jgi:hypothetical protein